MLKLIQTNYKILKSYSFYKYVIINKLNNKSLIQLLARAYKQ